MTTAPATRGAPITAINDWLRRVSRPAAATEQSAATRAVTAALLTLAGLACWLVVYGLLLSGIEEAHSQHNLYNQFRMQLAAGTAPLGGAVPEGTPVALLNSPAAGLSNVVVVEGTSSKDLELGPGHLPGVVLPGQAGASVIMGRATTFGGPFGRITHAAVGAPITAVTAQGTFTYTVEDIRRPNDPLPAPLAAGGSQLTLVTSEGGGWRNGWAPTHQVYVDALLKGKAVPAPSSVGIPSESDQVMHADPRGLYPLVLWLQLLLVALIAAAWARKRWGLWQTWIVGTPVAFAALWGASGSLWQVLPNVL